MQVLEITNKDYDVIFKMLKTFYNSSALSHSIDTKIIERTLNDVISKKYSIKGYKCVIDDKIIGFSFVTTYYSSEIGGNVAQIEDIYIDENYRSKGYGKEFLTTVMKLNQNVKRYRLEVMPNNLKAKAFYKSLGFYNIVYDQLIIEL